MRARGLHLRSLDFDVCLNNISSFANADGDFQFRRGVLKGGDVLS